MKRTVQRGLVSEIGTTGITEVEDLDGAMFKVRDFEKVDGKRYTNRDQNNVLNVYLEYAVCNVEESEGNWPAHHVLFQQGSELTAFCTRDELKSHFTWKK